jgi:hypothetical protein
MKINKITKKTYVRRNDSVVASRRGILHDLEFVLELSELALLLLLVVRQHLPPVRESHPCVIKLMKREILKDQI